MTSADPPVAPTPDARPQPTAGTSTFLFTDIEGSTRLIQEQGNRYPQLLEDHRRLVSEAVEAHGGRVFGSEGDALFSAFPSATAAIEAAAAAQRSLAHYAWPPGAEIRVRMGLHTGEAVLIGTDYVGLALHQAARITAAGHGGQVLISDPTRRLAARLPEGLELRDLGERRLKDLASPERIHQLVGQGLADKFAPLRTLDTKANNLPVQLTSFVGRDELAAARTALNGTRLLTLSGPGGTGKTRLALQLAAEASDDFPDGVWFVALDSVRDASLVASVIASTLGPAVGGSVSPLDALIDHLSEKRVLLVLDNFEQIVEAAGNVSRLLREAPHVKVIVTTRIVLRISGEQEFPVPPLGLPPAGSPPLNAEQAARFEAVRLFTERAMAVQPSFVLTDESAPQVVEIVQRLDGLPLAIELAAARTRVLAVSAIRARLGQHLTLLTGGARDLPERQQTLRGAIDWSYELLEGADRRLFERFSVHRGGAYLTEADSVCGPPSELGEDVLDGLSSLAEKSLVKAGLNGFEDPRFSMLVTIRDYAHERLSAGQEYEELARRHAQAYLALVESHSSELIGRRAREVADRLETDHDNLRAALDWAVEHTEVEFALRFVVAVWRFWQTRGHLLEARERVDRILSLPGVADQPDELVSNAYAAAGGITYWQGDTRATHDYYVHALEAARKTSDRRLIAESLYNLAFAPLDMEHPSQEGFAAGQALVEESLAIYREIGDTKGVADANWALSIGTAAAGGDMREAIRHGEEALALYRQLENPFGTGWASYMIGSLRVRDDPPELVEPYFREALRIFARAADQSGILLLLGAYTILADRARQTERFHTLGGAVQRLRDESGAGLADVPVDFMDYALPEKPTDDQAALKLWDHGSRMSTEEAIAYALGDNDADEIAKPEDIPG
ncbi:MAG: ATP-binding protein [Candidatus Limnocylindrales bacterium]